MTKNKKVRDHALSDVGEEDMDFADLKSSVDRTKKCRVSRSITDETDMFESCPIEYLDSNALRHSTEVNEENEKNEDYNCHRNTLTRMDDMVKTSSVQTSKLKRSVVSNRSKKNGEPQVTCCKKCSIF